MSELKVGMYVRCSVDYEDAENPRMFAMGQIEEIDDYKVRVVFHENCRSKHEKLIYDYIPSERVYDIDLLVRCKILNGTDIIYGFDIGKIISFAGKSEDNTYNYYVKLNDNTVIKVNECDIMADFNRMEANPYNQMISYEFHNPFWYSKRRLASEAINMINNFGDGFETLIGARAYLLPHQIDTIVRALSEKECRLMLADEVGLGKTIEALLIIKGLKKRKERVLLIVPEALVNQWKNELELKLWMDSTIYNGNNFNNGEIIIVPVESVSELYISDIKNKFAYCVIDEVHRVVGEEKIYSKILSICKAISKVLLLSATPIQSRKDEYLKLLKLLKPSLYENMTEQEFMNLFDKNSSIKKIVYRIFRDLPEAYGDEIDKDCIEDIMYDLDDIADELEDKCLDKIISSINIESDDCGESKIREALAYISINYQFEKNIIRHRRQELKELLPERKAEVIEHEMKSSVDNYYESNCYDELIEYIRFLQINIGLNKNLQEYIRILLNSFFSSPWAFNSVVELRKKTLKENKNIEAKIIDIVSSVRKERIRIESIIRHINKIPGEEQYLDSIDEFLQRWISAAEEECKNAQDLINDPDDIKGKLLRVIDYIEEELFNEKIVIFTSWPETLEKIKKLLEDLYGVETVTTFYSKNSFEDLEKNAFRFQNDENCRFILCDELGGEGRNFQMADAVIHMDIPFSPSILEQRIGRLDRIGRDKNKKVLNIVPVTLESIEESLYKLWDKGLNIFKKSLSGLEIALEDINNSLLEALNDDIKYGLDEAIDNIKEMLEEMSKSIEEEQYYDMAKQLDYDTEKKYNDIIEHFDNQGGRLLGKMMFDWGRAAGFEPLLTTDLIVEFDRKSVSNASMKHTMFAIPDTTKSLKRSKKPNVIRGTFDRKIAVNKEDLVFFAPGEEIFESIMNNVKEGYRGKSIAIKVNGAPFNWSGFVFKYNINFDVNKLLDNNIDLRYRKYAYGNMPIKQYSIIHSLTSDSMDVQGKVQEFMENNLTELVMKKKIYNYGSRGNNNIKIFKKEHDSNRWKHMVYTAYKKSQEEVKEQYRLDLNISEIKSKFSAINAGAKASELYFNSKENSLDLKNALEQVMKGIVFPKITTDSIMYLEMVE